MASKLRGNTWPVISPQGQAAVWSIMARGASTFVGFVSILLIGLCLDANAQGYFYTIVALAAFLPLADFGVSYATMQSASHEASGLHWVGNHLQGEIGVLRRVGALLRVGQLLNGLMTALAVAVLALVGTRVLETGGQTPAGLLWQWGGVLTFATAGQLLSPRIALLEGAGQVREVWRFRFTQELVGGTVLAAGLLAGAGLWGLVASGAGRVVYTLLWLGRRQRALSRLPVEASSAALAHWRQDVWPFQWKIGISALCGFFIFYLFTPVLLVAQGPVVAGQFGMTLALASGIQNVTTAWLNSQAPHFGTLVAAEHYKALDIAFGRTFRRSTLLALLGTLSAVGSLSLLIRFAPALAERLLPPEPFALLMAAAFINHVIFAIAVYLRAHRKDPLLVPSIVGAVAMSIAVPWAARAGTSTTVVGSYLSLNLIGFVAAVTIFVVCRRRWHLVEHAAVGS